MENKKVKKIPLRKCMGCMESHDKSALIRVVRSPEGEISLDKTGKKSGRGVYICRNPLCLEAALKGKRLEKALEHVIPPEVTNEIKEVIYGQQQDL